MRFPESKVKWIVANKRKDLDEIREAMGINSLREILGMMFSSSCRYK